MLIQILSNLGIIATLLANMAQQVEELQLKVEELVKQEEVIEEVIEPDLDVQLDVQETFKCKYDHEICDCEVMVKGQAIAHKKSNCEHCPRFEIEEIKTYYNPAEKKYFSLEVGECKRTDCDNCEELNYWADTFLDCQKFVKFRGSCLDDWVYRNWQTEHYFGCWMDKCVKRGTKGYRYLSESGSWVETELPEDYSY